MRLIDKDRLLKGTNHYWLEMENFGDIEAIDVRFIEMAEEVKAIPIEQLREWQRHYGNKCTYGTIMKCVEAWEKENEQSDPDSR